MRTGKSKQKSDWPFSRGLVRKGRRASEGFSLLELTAALFVLVVGMFGAIQMYRVGVDKTQALSEAAIAVSAVQNELEALRTLPFDALRNTENGRFLSETPALGKLANAAPWVVIADYDGDRPGLKQVTVSVRWTGEHGRAIEKSVTTLIGDKGRT